MSYRTREIVKRFSQALAPYIVIEQHPEYKKDYDSWQDSLRKYDETKDETYLHLARHAEYQLTVQGFFSKLHARNKDIPSRCFCEMIEKKSYEKLLECVQRFPSKLVNILNVYQEDIRKIIKDRIKTILKETSNNLSDSLIELLEQKFSRLPYIDIQSIVEKAKEEFQEEINTEQDQSEPHKRERFFLQKSKRRP